MWTKTKNETIMNIYNIFLNFFPRFDVKTGILQGDVLAPFLFIIVMDYIIKKTEQTSQYGFKSHPKSGSRNPEKSISDLEFADDAALLDDELRKAELHLQALNDNSLPTGLIINTDKTAFMNLADKQTIKLNGKDLETVDDFKYLGSYIISTNKDLKFRKSLAWSAFWRMKKIWYNKTYIKPKLKLSIFNTTCVPILLYGCESWILNEKHQKDINSFATSCYRVMMGIKRTDHVSNIDTLKMIKSDQLYKKVIKRQLEFIGHILRLPDDEPAKVYALYEPSIQLGQSKRGKPKETYTRYIANSLFDKSIANTITAVEIQSYAKDRDKWKKLVINRLKTI